MSSWPPFGPSALISSSVQVLLQLVALEQVEQVGAHRDHRLLDDLGPSRPRPRSSIEQIRFISRHSGPSPGSRRGCARRATPARSSAARATHSLTTQHVAQVQREVPARVELPVRPRRATFAARSLSSSSLASACFDLFVLADDADQVVHRLLQFRVQRVRVLAGASRVGERRQGACSAAASICVLVELRVRPASAVDVRRPRRFRRAGRTPAGPTASCRRAGSSRACRRPPRRPRTGPATPGAAAVSGSTSTPPIT